MADDVITTRQFNEYQQQHTLDHAKLEECCDDTKIISGGFAIKLISLLITIGNIIEIVAPELLRRAAGG